LSERKEIVQIAHELPANCSPGLPSQLLPWIAKSRLKQSRLKQGKYPLEITGFGNLAEPEGNFFRKSKWV
jgi:hypothetical protein